mmetsp:Transcript_29246/g.75014  ORF Transcript_29246/g.75014 Transcript_29246/m.75014 type:complete len:308 (-) Transcript_29246:1309-2232(-)
MSSTNVGLASTCRPSASIATSGGMAPAATSAVPPLTSFHGAINSERSLAVRHLVRQALWLRRMHCSQCGVQGSACPEECPGCSEAASRSTSSGTAPAATISWLNFPELLRQHRAATTCGPSGVSSISTICCMIPARTKALHTPTCRWERLRASMMPHAQVLRSDASASRRTTAPMAPEAKTSSRMPRSLVRRSRHEAASRRISSGQADSRTRHTSGGTSRRARAAMEAEHCRRSTTSVEQASCCVLGDPTLRQVPSASISAGCMRLSRASWHLASAHMRRQPRRWWYCVAPAWKRAQMEGTNPARCT